MIKPLVSIITVVKNGEKTIKRCIESVLKQTYDSIEHVIIDGASDDGTVSILKSYGNKIGPWISEPDSGIYDAINKGVRISNGEFYLPLGCDDILYPNAVLDLLSNAGGDKIIMGYVNCADRSGSQTLIRNHSAGVLIPKIMHNKIGYYDESYRIAADTKFLQTANRLGFVKYVDVLTGRFFLGGASSDYAKTIREHSRAMYEAGCWSKLKSHVWALPRMLRAKIKR